MTPKRQPSKKKPATRLKDTPRLPASKKGRPARTRKIDRHVRSLYGTVYCLALKSNVAFKKFPTKEEMRYRSSIDKDSTLFALNIEQLLQTATLDRVDEAKRNTKAQQAFDKMYILKKYVKGHGTAKIVVGHFQKPDLEKAPYCQYSVTRLQIAREKRKKNNGI